MCIRDRLSELLEVRRFANDRRRQLPMEPVQRRRELRLISHFHHYRRRAEHLFLQDLITVEQQADISLNNCGWA